MKRFLALLIFLAAVGAAIEIFTLFQLLEYLVS